MNTPVSLIFARNTLRISLVVIYILLVIDVTAQTDPLRRRAVLGVSISAPNGENKAKVRKVDPNSPAAKADLRSEDIITHINGKEINNPITYSASVRAIRAGDNVRLTIVRQGNILSISFIPAPLVRESISGIDTTYGFVTTEAGYKLRTIITKPSGVKGRLPAVLFIQWLSCDSIEIMNAPSDGVEKILSLMATKSGFILMRVERPGLGDSEGPDCSANDLKTDLAGFRAALAALKSNDFVDTNNLFIFGASIGGGLTPIIAQGENIRGLIITGGFSKTWFEHMIEHERRRLELSGHSQAEINDAMRGYSEFYSMYLNQKQTPAQVIQQKPNLAVLWSGQPAHQYGRPASYFQQVNDLNVEGAWEKISSPLLVVYGEYDWVMSRSDHESITEIVNKKHPGNARLVVIPKASHSLDVFENQNMAFKGEGAKFDESIADLMINWLKNNVKITP